MSITLLLVVLALVFTVGAAVGRAPLWMAVFLLVLVELLRIVPR